MDDACSIFMEISAFAAVWGQMRKGMLPSYSLDKLGLIVKQVLLPKVGRNQHRVDSSGIGYIAFEDHILGWLNLLLTYACKKIPPWLDIGLT